MLKQYLSQNKISLYKLAKESGVPYSTLNDLANHKLSVENMKSFQLHAISDSLHISMNELYDMCLFSKPVSTGDCNIQAYISIKHKQYYLTFLKNGVKYAEPIISVKQNTSEYIDTLAEWKLKEKLSDIKMEEAYESILS